MINAEKKDQKFKVIPVYLEKEIKNKTKIHDYQKETNVMNSRGGHPLKTSNIYSRILWLFVRHTWQGSGSTIWSV